VAKQQEPGSGICYSNYVSQSSTKRSLDSNVVNNSTTASEEIQEEALIRRADPGYVAFPGDWTYGPAQRPPSPNELLEDGVSDLIGDATEGALGCRNCGSCTDTKDKSGKKPCCGCVSMDYKWSFDDIPSTPYCLCCSSSPNNGKWPTGSKRIRLGSAKRGFNSSEDETFEEQDDAVDDEDDEGETTLHELEGRARPTIRTGSKTVTMCALSDYAPAPGNYPQFPDEPTKPWEGVQRGIWDPISRYWGNTSGLCTDWSVGALTYHDNDTTPQGKLRSNYQSMYPHDDTSKIC
jgi:chitinase